MVFILLGTGCNATLDPEKRYDRTLCQLNVELKYPAPYEKYAREGVRVTISDIKSQNVYVSETDNNGCVSFNIPQGYYNIVASDKVSTTLFNGSSPQVRVVEDLLDFRIDMEVSYASSIVIREIYFSGCTKYPVEGTYQNDKYVIIHNNASSVYYLDGLCFGMVDPYNSTGTNVWTSVDPNTGQVVYPDFLPIADCVWQIKGSGTDFPLQPGGDAVIAINGAIDHSAQFPNSVNLNRSDYFVLYNEVLYPNTSYHPVPGDQIRQDHILELLVKVNASNAYPFSNLCPTAILYKAQGCTMAEYIQEENVIIPKPGATNGARVVMIPVDWALDAVEVYTGQSSDNRHRLPSRLDAGAITFYGQKQGHVVSRKVDENLTSELGYTVYVDTNNSDNDFVELDTQSIKNWK